MAKLENSDDNQAIAEAQTKLDKEQEIIDSIEKQLATRETIDYDEPKSIKEVIALVNTQEPDYESSRSTRKSKDNPQVSFRTDEVIYQRLDRRKNLGNKAKRELEEISQILFFIWSIKSHERAASTLEHRSEGQDCSDFGIRERISLIEKKFQQLRSNLDDNCYLKRDYIAPEGVEVNSYSVKHPPSSNFSQDTPQEEIKKNQKVYIYHKLQNLAFG